MNRDKESLAVAYREATKRLSYLQKTKYQVEDAVKAAFSVFFTQSPSFLEHQRLMKSSKGKDNTSSLFGIKKIPCDNQI